MTQTGSIVSIVTGGAGFIGSHLCEKLLSLDYRVYCLDNLITGNDNNIEVCKKNPLFSFLRCDVTKDLPIFPKVDYVFHLASPASVIDYQKYPEETALVNSVGTRNLLKFSKAYRAKFLFASTSEIYGDPKEHPQKETYWGNVNPIGIRACYDESKRFGETLTMLYIRKYDLDGRIIRIFNTYGPNMRKDDGRVVSNFINQALEEKPITIYGKGTQTRSFCYVSDLVSGIVSVATSNKTKGEVYNLGNPEEFTVIKLANLVKSLIKSQSKIIHSDLPQDDPTQRKPDISKIKSFLGWKPKVKLEEGLRKTIEYYKTLDNEHGTMSMGQKI